MSEVHPFGHLEGVVTKVNDHGRGYFTYEVMAVNGVTCHVSDLYGEMRSFPARVGVQLVLEEATVLFESGVLVYMIDQQLRGVTLDGVDLDAEPPRRSPSAETLADLARFAREGSFASAMPRED